MEFYEDAPRFLQKRFYLGNPLTTSNCAPEKSRIRFLGVPGDIFLKILCWKIHDFSMFTPTKHLCFEKDLVTIVVARSTESYFPLYFSWKTMINTQLCRFCNYPWALFPVVNWRRDLPNFICPLIINMTKICYYPRPFFTVVKIPAKLEFTFGSRRRCITFVKNELDFAVFNGYFVTIALLLWKICQWVIS